MKRVKVKVPRGKVAQFRARVNRILSYYQGVETADKRRVRANWSMHDKHSTLRAG